MMLEQITPVITTYNEAPNIARTLEPLAWAREIIIVDSLSTDDTLDLATRSPQVRVIQRQFDGHANQWTFALTGAGITTEWVLALDADYVLTPEFVDELKTLTFPAGVAGYQARFVYCVNGRPLRGSAYPPVTVLYRRELASYRQDGHSHSVELRGKVEKLNAPILHDDRKSIDHWLRSQSTYMRLECIKLVESDWRTLGWADRVRKLRVVAPLAMFFYCLFFKRAILDGRAGLFYSLQRLLAELILSLYLIEHSFLRSAKKPVIATTGDEDRAAPLTAVRQRK